MSGDGDLDPRIRAEPDFDGVWPGASALATECILNATIWLQAVQAHGEGLIGHHGIPSAAAFNALEILRGAQEPLLPSVLAARMIISRPTMTGIVRTLVRHGLAERRSHERDGRMVRIAITAEGRARVERLLPELHRAEARIMSCMSREEQQTFLGFLARLQHWSAGSETSRVVVSL